MLTSQKGFTVLELLLVVLVIGIVAAFILPKIGDTKQKTYVAAMKNDLRNFATAQENYAQENDGYAQSPSDITNFAFSEGVTTVTTSANAEQSWQLTVKHEKADADMRCVLKYGTGDVDDRQIHCGPDVAGEPTFSSISPTTVWEGIDTDISLAVDGNGAVNDIHRIRLINPSGSSFNECALNTMECTLTMTGTLTSFVGPGTYGGRFLWLDEAGDVQFIDKYTIDVKNNTPTAMLVASDTTVYEGDTIQFDASASWDAGPNGGEITSYTFTAWGPRTDQETVSTPTWSWTPDENEAQGTYSAYVNVEDAYGLNDRSDTVEVTVLDGDPVAVVSAAPDTVFFPDDTLTIDGSGSYHENPNYTIDLYNFVLREPVSGDALHSASISKGSPPVTTWPASFGWLDEHAGKTLQAQLEVSDGRGKSSQAQEDVVYRDGRSVTMATIDKTAVAPGETVTVDASSSYDPNGTIVSYSFTLLDTSDGSWVAGGQQESPTFSWTPDASHSGGTFEFQVNAQDDDNYSPQKKEFFTVTVE